MVEGRELKVPDSCCEGDCNGLQDILEGDCFVEGKKFMEEQTRILGGIAIVAAVIMVCIL